MIERGFFVKMKIALRSYADENFPVSKSSGFVLWEQPYLLTERFQFQDEKV